MTDLTPGQRRVIDEVGTSFRQAIMFGQFLDSLTAPMVERTQPVIDMGAKVRRNKNDRIRDRLRERDGDDCWLCGEPLGDDATIEHHVPKAKGGTDADDNLRLCHELCNKALAHRSLEQKLALRKATRESALNPGGM